jgi:hypothetical protein
LGRWRLRAKPNRQHHKIGARYDAGYAIHAIRLSARNAELSIPDFSDATGRLMSESSSFTLQVGDALPILEQVECRGNDVQGQLGPSAEGAALKSTANADLQMMTPSRQNRRIAGF